MVSQLTDISWWPLINVAALMLYMLSVRKLTVFSFIFLGTLVLEALHTGIEFYLQSVGALQDYSLFGFLAWYLTFGLSDMAFGFLIIAAARHMALPLNRVCQFLIGLFLLLGVLQILTMIERLTLQSALVGEIYPLIIFAVNTAISVILLGYSARTVISAWLNTDRAA